MLPSTPSAYLDSSHSQERSRLQQCWIQATCNTCLESAYKCGWCAFSGTCIPVPGGYLTPLISAPLHDRDVCPTYDDRWEFRTATLGCKVSNMTVMTCIVTVLCTLVGVAVLWCTGKAARWGWRVYVKGNLSGWEYTYEQGISDERLWWRGWKYWLGEWKGKIDWRRKGEEDERTRLLDTD